MTTAVRKQPRVAGFFDERLAGLGDFLRHAAGRTVLDIGCNRGLVSFEFARHGARLVHGCDNYTAGIVTASEIFQEAQTDGRFVEVDLSKGVTALKAAFGSEYQPQYDIVLYLGVHHHLRRQMSPQLLLDLVRHLLAVSAEYFVCRTPLLDEVAALASEADLVQVHYSRLERAVSPLAIWQRKQSN